MSEAEVAAAAAGWGDDELGAGWGKVVGFAGGDRAASAVKVPYFSSVLVEVSPRLTTLLA